MKLRLFVLTAVIILFSLALLYSVANAVEGDKSGKQDGILIFVNIPEGWLYFTTLSTLQGELHICEQKGSVVQTLAPCKLSLEGDNETELLIAPVLIFAPDGWNIKQMWYGEESGDSYYYAICQSIENEDLIAYCVPLVIDAISQS